MTFSEATSQDSSLSNVLEQITAIDREIDLAEMRVKELKKRRDALANVAVEEMTGGRLDGVRVAGRSWRVEWEHRVSASGEHQDEVLEAARKAGLAKGLVSVNTSRLKTLLKEMARDSGRDPREPWAEGTPFAGIVSEYVQPVLRHITTG